MEKKNIIIILLIYIITALLITIVLLIGTIKEKNNYYPITGIITELNKEKDTVTFTDLNGNMWNFYGIEDFMLNDVIAVMMDTVGTMEIFDDEIINVRYCGTIEK